MALALSPKALQSRLAGDPDPSRRSWIETVLDARDASVEIRRLLDLSDEGLAARGLARTDVVAHVYQKRARR